MFSATVARNIAGIFGNLILLFVFTSPIPSFITICKNKKVEGYKAEPYLATALNCALWVLYGLPIVDPGNIIVIPINATGVVIEFGYLAIIFYYSPTSRKVKLGLWFIGEMVFVGIVTTCTLLLFHTHEQRSTFVGILLIISSSCLIYIAPLTIMTKVIKTKSVKYMPFSLSLAYFLNGVVWVTRALIKFDMFSLIVNGLGTVPGAVQLILYAIYYKTTPKDDEDEGADNNSKVNSQSQDSQLSGNQEEA